MTSLEGRLFAALGSGANHATLTDGGCPSMLKVTLEMDPEEAVNRLFPLMAAGVAERLVSPDEAMELIAEATIAGIKLDCV